jgi:hypothetical protein
MNTAANPRNRTWVWDDGTWLKACAESRVGDASWWGPQRAAPACPTCANAPEEELSIEYAAARTWTI